jgi:hypothetical protein
MGAYYRVQNMWWFIAPEIEGAKLSDEDLVTVRTEKNGSAIIQFELNNSLIVSLDDKNYKKNKELGGF